VRESEHLQDRYARLFRENPEARARYIIFQVTEACNLCCTYCYQGAKTTNSMSFDVAKQLIDELLTDDPRTASGCSSWDSPGVVLEFIGGEPLLKVELIDEITDYFISRCIELRHPWGTRYFINICTNGTLYFDPRFQEYIRKNIRHLSFNVTVDGNRELHDSCRLRPDGTGSYDSAIAAVKHWREHWNGYMGSKLTLSPDNLQYCAKAIIDMIEFGYDDIHFNPVFEEGWTIEHARLYYQELKKLADYLIENRTLDTHSIPPLNPRWGHPMRPEDNDNWCGGVGGHMLAVDYKGNLYPCLRYMETSLNGKQEPYTIGNIHEGFTRKDRLECLNCITRRSQSSDECFNCPIASGCAWCSAYNYEVFGTPNARATYTCAMHKALSLALCYLWNMIYRQRGSDERYSLDCPKEWALGIINEEEYDLLKSLSEKTE
jgi:radical SAM peptide maturase (CXXX-repeat target family)